jgi:lipoprotein-anchoring transpeptidase ErfK/SrfK
MRVAGHRGSIQEFATPRIWRVAILTAVGAIGTASKADAALYYWRDSEPGAFSQQDVRPPQKQQRTHRASPKKNVVVKDTTVHPQMPLIITVSIQKQQVKVYDANGFFAEAPVSTGMPGHPTPMGVFSVIEKDRYHHSNIYSGAPMPFMQRITWSGVAMHAGVLPGYPASHGCIRMPESFAIKMWGWTKMGARVIVTPGELSTPVSFAHSLLPAMKVMPVAQQPQTDEPLAAKADKGAAEVTQVNLELRPTVGHTDVTPVTLREKTRTADAGSDGSDVKSMSDAPKIGAKADNKADTAPSTSTDPTNHATVAEAKVPDVAPSAKPAEAASEDKSAASDAAAKVETKSEQSEAAAKPDGESARPEDNEAAPAKAKAAEVKTEAAKPDEPVKAAETAAETRVEPAKAADAPKADAATKGVASTAPAKAEPAKTEQTKTEQTKAGQAKTAVADTAPSGPKDQTRVALPGAKQAKRRDGQIAVFISRKDSKLYVRQNFAPLFDVPVTIAPSDRPLGTHIFTAEIDKNDSNMLHWSVVTVPSRAAMREEPRKARTKKGKLVAAPVEAKPAPAMDTPAEALDRITIPADVMARIMDALTTGGSIIVSDQGINQGETGEGTDFIVSLR